MQRLRHNLRHFRISPRGLGCAALAAAYAFASVGLPLWNPRFGDAVPECRCSAEAKSNGGCCCSRSQVKDDCPTNAPPPPAAARACCRAAQTAVKPDSPRSCCSAKQGSRSTARSTTTGEHTDDGPRTPAISSCPCGADSLPGMAVVDDPRLLTAAVSLPAFAPDGAGLFEATAFVPDRRPAPETPPPEAGVC